MNRRDFLGWPLIVPAMCLLGPSRATRGGQFGADSKIYHGEKPDKVLKLVGSGQFVGSAAFSGDGSTLILGHGDGSVRRYDASTGRETGNFQVRVVPDSIQAIAFAPDGRTFAIAAPVNEPWKRGSFPMPRLSWHGEVSISDDSGREIRRFPRMSGKVLALAFSKDGRQIAAMDQMYISRTWQVDDGVESFKSEAHKSNGQNTGCWSSRAGFSSDLKRAVVLNDCPEGDYGGTPWDNVVRLIEAGEREPRTIHYEGGMSGSVAISADSSRVVTADKNPLVTIWDFATGRRLSSSSPMIPLGVPEVDRVASFVAFSPDGRRIVAGSRRFAWVHEDDQKETGNAFRTFEGPGGYIRAAAFLRDRVRFASGGLEILKDEGEVKGGSRSPKFEPITIWDVKVPEKK